MKRDRLDVSTPASEADLSAFGAILEQALSFPADLVPGWCQRMGRANLFLARRGGTVLGGFALLPVGQWFGGERVPCAAIAAVAVALEHRATGVGAALMRHALAEAGRRGLPISALYPATYPIYRAAGYEVAGDRWLHRLPTAAFDGRVRSPAVRPLVAADRPTLRHLHAERSRRTCGPLDRDDHLWTRVLSSPTPTPVVRGYLVEGERGGPPEGYVVFVQAMHPGSNRYDVRVRDVVASTPAAACRLGAVFAHQRSMAEHVLLPVAPADPLLLLARDHKAEVESHEAWMIRLVDVPAALAARGYARGVAGTLHLDVEDDVVPANAGRFVLRVARGRATVRRGGQGRVAAHVRGLAPLYTGRLPASDLAAAGLLRGPGADLDLASALFAGPAPWMGDTF